ncbi:hypothetical protein C8J43_10410 [Sphingomonas sp. PP-CE-1G-424]|nr:hypothetical protein C8J43_10410 [Sphingomonas sp. PP-CE-1G-424]
MLLGACRARAVRRNRHGRNGVTGVAGLDRRDRLVPRRQITIVEVGADLHVQREHPAAGLDAKRNIAARAQDAAQRRGLSAGMMDGDHVNKRGVGSGRYDRLRRAAGTSKEGQPGMISLVGSLLGSLVGAMEIIGVVASGCERGRLADLNLSWHADPRNRPVIFENDWYAGLEGGAPSLRDAAAKPCWGFCRNVL